MRRLLLTIASFVVGLMTVCLIFAAFTMGWQSLFGFLILWAAALLVGIVLSAPFFLRPPEDQLETYWSLPLTFWIVAQAVKVINWVGWTVLRGSWYVLHLALPGGGRVDADLAPVPLPATAATSASWLPDPTRRFQLRYWDGNQWTDHVSSNGVQSTDTV